MNHHATLDDARSWIIDNGILGAIETIIRIDHATDGERYICSKESMSTLRSALGAKPIAEIKRLIDEHDKMMPDRRAIEDRRAAARDAAHAAARTCDRCNDPMPCSRELYCGHCKAVLNAVGAGDYTAMQERHDGGYRSDRTPWQKGDNR